MTHGRPDGAEFGEKLMEAAQSNPVAAALVGMGIAWLFAGGNRATLASVVGNDDRQTHSSAKVSQSASQLADTAASATDAIARTASSAQKAGATMLQSLSDDVADLLERKPLVIGLAGVVVGAAIGTAFQATGMEKNVLGELGGRPPF
jgi:hypothetical protein